MVAVPHSKAFYERRAGPDGESEALFEGEVSVRPQGATSAAAAVVTAAVALVRSHRPGLTEEKVVSAIENSADDVGETGFDEFTGYGRLNCRQAIELAGSTYNECRLERHSLTGEKYDGAAGEICRVEILFVVRSLHRLTFLSDDRSPIPGSLLRRGRCGIGYVE